MDVIKEGLRVPAKYMKTIDYRICITTHKSWLSSLQLGTPIAFIDHHKFTADEIATEPSIEELGPNWIRIYAKVYEKQNENAIPLPRGRNIADSKTQVELTFSQLLRYVSETNYRNLWKESYKKYYGPWNRGEQKEQSHLTADTTDVVVMREVIARAYGCTLLQVQNGTVVSMTRGAIGECHSNLLPALFAVETDSAFIIFHDQTASFSLRECATYSPAALNTIYAKPLFLVYQLLRLSRDLHDMGLVLGEITLSDILITDNFTIQVLPKLSDNVYLQRDSEANDSSTERTNESKPRDRYKKIDTSLSKDTVPVSPDFGANESIGKLCEYWVYGSISNFDYLTALNNIAGRRYGDPSCHHVMPWVTDFTSRCGNNWRDLTKSKFRLNKGDRQLDLTFDSDSVEVGHHVSDVLSEITYYVYLSRRYSKSILCKHVRPLWVPGEYPASIQRLHDWSPDECIPQFFSDPSVFKSIHEDLPDLEIPAWATSPEDFIEKHREALESLYVSERLHHWIDLTFGYKLSGAAAVKSKNVCLQLVDNHTELTNSGVVQLFTQPHPQRIVPSPYWGKVAPRLRPTLSQDKTKTEQQPSGKVSDDEGHSSGFEEEELSVPTPNTSRSSPLVLSKLLSRSRGSLLTNEDSAKTDKTVNQTIILPKDYNPVAALVQVETMHAFVNKVSHRIYKAPVEPRNSASVNYKQVVARGRIKEQLIIGCLIVEIFLSSKFRATWNIDRVSFAERLATCISTLKESLDSLPRCVRNAVALLLQVDIVPKSYGIDCTEIAEVPFRYPTVTYMGLPPPSAHQFLQPILSGNLFPPSRYNHHLYNVVQMLQEYNVLTRNLNFVTQAEEYNETLGKTKITYLCKISECKVKDLSRELDKLLSDVDMVRESNLQLLVPHIRNILEESYSAVLAAWYLFDPIAKALGPKDTADVFLESIVKLYEGESVLDSIPCTDALPPGTLLYHRSFILKLIVRLGLRRFLDNFVTPLVEAVGGYRDYTQGSSNIVTHRAGNLKSCDLSGTSAEGEIVLSPLDEDSSADSEHNASTSSATMINEPPTNLVVADNDIEEVFTMDPENNSWTLSATDEGSYDIDFHQIDLNLSSSEEPAEEGNKSSPSTSVKSPTIPIPKRINKSVMEFSSIGCHVGSKTSTEDIPVETYGEEDLSDNHTSAMKNEETASTSGLRGAEKMENEEEEVTEQEQHPRQKSAATEFAVSQMATDSIIWLSHRLGPVLTARHLSRNLLRMLTLCYAGKENLMPINGEENNEEVVEYDDKDSVNNDDPVVKSNSKKKVFVGDRNSLKVLECLHAIAGLYGEQIILLQYFAHMAELLTLCKKKLTQNLEGGLVSCVVLFNHLIPSLSDVTLIDALHEPIVKAILNPTIRILSTTRFTFPNGPIARSALAEKCLEALFNLCLRLGSVITKNHLAVPIQRFFLVFDKTFDLRSDEPGPNEIKIPADRRAKMPNKSPKDCDSEMSKEWNVIDEIKMEETADSYSPPVREIPDIMDSQRNKALEELKTVFTTEFAHRAYMMFYRQTYTEDLEEILKNHDHIRDLCHVYEEELKIRSPLANANRDDFLQNAKSAPEHSECVDRNNFGNISLIGNRFQLQKDEDAGSSTAEVSTNRETLSTSINGRQLRGNWLAYWEHEIGRPDKSTAFNVKQIKLQSFGGHVNSIRCIHALDNENSFISGSRDKTVKLWSLRSQGDGSTVSPCQYTYTGHKKSILALTFLESLRYVATCDGTVHIWDPFMGSLLGYPESSKPSPVNTLASSPAPSATLLVATTDITLRVIDCRTFQYANEMKVSMNPTGLIRCIAVSPSGNWVALGQASGFLTILDIRTGLIIASWKGHECEILQLEAVGETMIISSSLDQTIAVWSALDGKLKFHMKGATEPVHCMSTTEQELVIGTTANRIGVYTSVDITASFSSSKLRSDAFKGVLTAMTILPLNRLLLLGADNGGIILLC